MKKQLSTYPLRLPTSLKTAVVEISKADGTSINQFVATAVAENRPSGPRRSSPNGRLGPTSSRRAGCCAARAASPRHPETGSNREKPRPLARTRSAAARCRCARPRRRVW